MMLGIPGMITLGMTSISGTLDSRPTSRLLTDLVSLLIVGLVETVCWRGFSWRGHLIGSVETEHGLRDLMPTDQLDIIISDIDSHLAV
jgi:hypothetical protein